LCITHGPFTPKKRSLDPVSDQQAFTAVTLVVGFKSQEHHSQDPAMFAALRTVTNETAHLSGSQSQYGVGSWGADKLAQVYQSKEKWAVLVCCWLQSAAFNVGRLVTSDTTVPCFMIAGYVGSVGSYLNIAHINQYVIFKSVWLPTKSAAHFAHEPKVEARIVSPKPTSPARALPEIFSFVSMSDFVLKTSLAGIDSLNSDVWLKIRQLLFRFSDLGRASLAPRSLCFAVDNRRC
jgi:hypothetical protein